MDLTVIIPAVSQCQFPDLNLIITFAPACPPSLNNLLSWQTSKHSVCLSIPNKTLIGCFNSFLLVISSLNHLDDLCLPLASSLV